MLGFVLVLLSVSAVPAQAGKGAVPENATAKAYGGGWECNPGYRWSNSDCVVVILPENSYLTGSSYGLGWKCSYGYKQNRDVCEFVALPANAYLSAAIEAHRRHVSP